MAEYNLPESLRYTKDDEWVRAEDDGQFRIGVTDYAQQQLGDVVFVELPEPGATYEAGQPFGVIESVKAVSDLFSPVDIRIVEVNGQLEDAPETVNADCYGEGWLIVVEPNSAAEVEALLDADGYRKTIDERAEDSD